MYSLNCYPVQFFNYINCHIVRLCSLFYHYFLLKRSISKLCQTGSISIHLDIDNEKLSKFLWEPHFFLTLTLKKTNWFRIAHLPPFYFLWGSECRCSFKSRQKKEHVCVCSAHWQIEEAPFLLQHPVYRWPVSSGAKQDFLAFL
jgi:hypothetical protein